MANAAEQQLALLSQVVAGIREFHATTDPNRRNQIHNALKELKKSNDGLIMSFYLLNFDQPTVVQHFGACILYDAFRERWDECFSNEELINKIKGCLVEKLSLGASFLNQSVTNKLTSALAMFALCCIPDIWSEPIRDLATLWSDKPELLLRVLAELAAEFHRVQLPLTQRSVLKSSLHQRQQDVIRVINLVLCDKDTSPSLRNAAVECLEQWLNLPGIDLNDWQPALLPFLSVLSDGPAFARILNVMASNPDLPFMEKLAMDLCTFLANFTCQSIMDQLQYLDHQSKSAKKDDFDHTAELEDYSLIIAALAGFTEAVMRPLLTTSAEKKDAQVLRTLCTFFEKISLWPGVYPIEEMISDAPESFWNTLKEDLMSSDGSRVSKEMRDELLREFGTYYIRLIWSAVTKLSFPPSEVLKSFDNEQVEKFESYRSQRVEVAANAFLIAPQETTDVLTKLLAEACSDGNTCRIEAILYLFERMADYMSEKDFATISGILTHSSNIMAFEREAFEKGCNWARFAKTLLQLLYALSHLVSTGDDAPKWETECVCMVLALLNRTCSTHPEDKQMGNVVEHALHTLDKFVGDGSGSCTAEVLETVLSVCYALFEDEQRTSNTRLLALRCVGHCIAQRSNDTPLTLQNMNAILTPRLQVLERLVSVNNSDTGSQCNQSADELRELEHQYLFELDTLATLLATQRCTRHTSKEASSLITQRQNAVTLAILDRSMPLLFSMLRRFSDAHDPVAKICDVLRSALVALDDLANMQQLFDAYCEVLDFIIYKHPQASVQLAKTLLLLAANSASASQQLIAHIDGWFQALATMDECDEEFIELAYHVVKKHWKTIINSMQCGSSFTRSIREMAVKVLATSNEANMSRKAAALLVMLVRNCVNNGDTSNLIADAGDRLLVVVFTRLQCESFKGTAEALAEVLMLVARCYPRETRQCLDNLPYGNTRQVADMLKEAHNVKIFRNKAMQFNMQRRKEMKT